MLSIISATDPLKILLIEDSKGDSILIEKILQQALPEMHCLQKVSTIEAALKELSQYVYDVALLDRTLPDAQGFNGLLQIQNFSPKLPIIFLTAYKDEESAFEAITQGAQDYIFKDHMDAHVIKRAIQYAVLRKQYEGVLIMRANYDMLTGLANRILFQSRLDMALERTKRLGGMISVLLLDLDKFKTVNDTLGHAAGDKLLQEVSHRLKESLRPYDTVARFGGDEFAILFEHLPKSTHSEIAAKKIINVIEKPFVFSGQAMQVGISIGIANCQSGEMSGDTLLMHADTAMYVAKSESKSAYRCYERSIS